MSEKLKTEEKTADPMASKSQSWWQTMPGMLTAVAGTLTALSGLLVALHQVGLLNSKEQPSPSTNIPSLEDTSQPTVSDTASEAKPLVPSNNSSASANLNGRMYSATFPAGNEVPFRNNRGAGTIKITATQVERRSVDKLSVKFDIRLTNDGPSDVGFGTDLFRLRIDGIDYAPVSTLIELVEARSAKEGTIEFEAPNKARSLVLLVLVGDNDEIAEIPVTLEE